MLQLLGHWAAGVRSAETAKDRFLEGAFDVLLTDIGLPALSGMDLVEILRARTQARRHLRDRPAAAGDADRQARVWLQKPFTVEQLEAALARR